MIHISVSSYARRINLLFGCSKKIYLPFFKLCVYECVCVRTRVFACWASMCQFSISKMPEDSVRSPRAGVTGDSELPGMGAGD